MEENKSEQLVQKDCNTKVQDKEQKLSEAEWAHIKCEFELTAWKGFAELHAWGYCYNPFNFIKILGYFISGRKPTMDDIGHSRDMVKCASETLSALAILGDVKKGEGIIQDLHADVNYLDRNGHTPLYHAIRSQQLPMAEMLLSKGADATLASKGSATAVGYAAATGNISALDLFAKYHVDFNQPKKYRVWNKYHLGYSVWHIHPLAQALCYDQSQACQKLLNYGASIDVEYNKKMTIRDTLTRRPDLFKPETLAVFKDVLATPQKVDSSTPQLPSLQNDHMRE